MRRRLGICDRCDMSQKLFTTEISEITEQDRVDGDQGELRSDRSCGLR